MKKKAYAFVCVYDKMSLCFCHLELIIHIHANNYDIVCTFNSSASVMSDNMAYQKIFKRKKLSHITVPYQVCLMNKVRVVQIPKLL